MEKSGLCVILGLVVHFTRIGMEAESIRNMQAAAAALGPPGRPGELPENFRLPYCIVRISREGRLFAAWGPGFQEVSEENLRTLVGHALQEEAPTGVLAAWQLRFLWVEGPERRLVCADIAQERAALVQLAHTCLLAGAAAAVCG